MGQGRARRRNVLGYAAPCMDLIGGVMSQATLHRAWFAMHFLDPRGLVWPFLNEVVASERPVDVGHFWMKLSPQTPFTLAIFEWSCRLKATRSRWPFLNEVVTWDPIHIGHFWMKLSPQTPFTLAIFEWSCFLQRVWQFFHLRTFEAFLDCFGGCRSSDGTTFFKFHETYLICTLNFSNC